MDLRIGAPTAQEIAARIAHTFLRCRLNRGSALCVPEVLKIAAGCGRNIKSASPRLLVFPVQISLLHFSLDMSSRNNAEENAEIIDYYAQV